MLLCVTRCNNMSVKCPNRISLVYSQNTEQHWDTISSVINFIVNIFLHFCCDSAVTHQCSSVNIWSANYSDHIQHHRICRRQDYLFTIIQNVFRCSRTRICWIVQQLLKLNCLQVRRTLPPEWLVLSGCSDPLTSSVSGGHFIISLLLLWSDR